MYPVSVKGVLFAPTGEVVLLRNDRDEWELPGGRIEMGESPQQCVAREIREELHIDAEAKTLLDAYLFEVIPSKHVFVVTYGCESLGPFIPRISDEHMGFGLFHPSALPDKLPHGYRASINAWLSAPSP